MADPIAVLQVLLAVLFMLVLAPLMLAGNFLVVWPFYRARRIRTPANILLFSLAVSDMISGLVLPIFTLLQLLRDYVSEPLLSCTLPLAFMVVAETSSVFFIVAIAVDKVISLAQPLRYSEIVTKLWMNVFIGLTWALSVVLGVLHATLSDSGPEATENDKRNGSFSSSSSSSKCFSRYYLSSSSSLRAGLFYGLVLPATVILTGCYLYVYFVASKHAKEILQVKRLVRSKEMGDSRLHIRREGNSSFVMKQKDNHLAPPSTTVLYTKNHNYNNNNGSSSLLHPPTNTTHTTTTGTNTTRSAMSSQLFIHGGVGGGERVDDGRHSAGSNSYSKRTLTPYSYGVTLAVNVLAFCACRFPGEIFSLIQGKGELAEEVKKVTIVTLVPVHDNSDIILPPPPRDLNDDVEWIAQLFYFPLFVSSLLNPWLYAYHNLDLKPLMRRMLRHYLRNAGLIKAADRCVTKFEATYVSQWHHSRYAHPIHYNIHRREFNPNQDFLEIPVIRTPCADRDRRMSKVSTLTLSPPPGTLNPGSRALLTAKSSAIIKEQLSESDGEEEEEEEKSIMFTRTNKRSSSNAVPAFDMANIEALSRKGETEADGNDLKHDEEEDKEDIRLQNNSSSSCGSSPSSFSPLPSIDAEEDQPPSPQSEKSQKRRKMLLLFSSQLPTVTVWLEGDRPAFGESESIGTFL